ncbi:MAG: ferredoxin [Patescibacteria group bacterium]
MPEKKIAVDPEKCIGCGACVALCPEVFEIGGDGKSRVKDQAGCEKCDCSGAIDGCPQQAIFWEE